MRPRLAQRRLAPPGRPPQLDRLMKALEMHRAGRLNEAELGYRKVLRVDPRNADALHLLGMIQKARGDVAGAVAMIRQALAQDPAMANAHLNLGNCLLMASQLGEAEKAFRAGLAVDALDGDGYLGLANCLFLTGKAEEAAAAYEECLAAFPDKAHARYGLGMVLVELGRADEGIPHLERAVALAPDNGDYLQGLVQSKLSSCHWQGLEPLVERLRAHVRGGGTVSPFYHATVETDPAVQKANAGRWWRANYGGISPLEATRRPVVAEKRPLVLGYLSADFHAHATAFLAAQLFELHDRNRFRVMGYSYGYDDGSPMRGRLTRSFDRFHDLQGADSAEIAQRMVEDGVDILVDLKGFTSRARPDLLALRPAPVLVHYLGHPGTLGGAVDFLIADTVVIPEHRRADFHETLALLPSCYQINDGRRAMAPSPSRGAMGLPEDAVVLCCFNSPYKITPAVFAIWMELLAAQPKAVLWLLAPRPAIADNLRREALARGIDPARLVFTRPLPHAEHLARYPLADLFLDTFPVTAHTTASDCLWAGCPLLTCLGESFMSRVAASVLQSVGLPELIASSLTDYAAKARLLVTRPESLAALKAGLKEKAAAAPVFDPLRTTRMLESAYEVIWKSRAG